jgi:ribosome-associated protein
MRRPHPSSVLAPQTQTEEATSQEALHERPSKTQRKKESHDLQDLGQRLCQLNETQRASLSLDTSLLDAIQAYLCTRSHEGKRRQLQYIGKLMRRQEDPEQLRERLAAFQIPSAQATLQLHQAEHWRERLIANDDSLTEWMELHPETDIQQLHSIIRGARKEIEATPGVRNGKAYRELFQLIKSAF